MKKITILTFVLCLFMASSVMAKTIYVKADAAGANDGTTLADAFTTFDIALADSVSGDTIIIDGEVSHSAASADVTYDLTIVGQNSAKLVGTGNGRLMNLGGLFTLNISNVSFENFVSVDFGGVLAAFNGANLIIDNCAFINNTTSKINFSGGAIYLGGANAIITNSLFKGNSASGATGRGGAIMSYASKTQTATLSITNSTFYDNSATDRGGAIFVWYTNIDVVPSGTFEAVNITVAKNSIANAASGNSGGIRLQAGLSGSMVSATIKNSLIFDNTEDSAGANTPMNIGSVNAARPIIENCVIGAVNGSVAGGTITNSVVNLDVADLTLDYTDIAAGTDAVVKYADATYPVNFGDASLLSPIVTDQKGTARDVADGKVDAGAWASGFINPLLSVTSNELKNDLSVFYSASLKTITINNLFDNNVSIDVYSILGTKVLSVSKITNKAIIEAGTLKSGIYILLAKSSNGKSVTKKFIVNN